MNKNFQIGISSFEKIRTENSCYIDKTHFIKKLVGRGSYYFLLRLQRFGKSLFPSGVLFKVKKSYFRIYFLRTIGIRI
ncbi:MAG: AAA family ATPase [Candidatus Calescibacterium sp.]|nr:AAA family ATPase [Candidatus Calescibacterium sp.]MCX7972859.1 AAA family ATPase [bacterium]MDW8195219.1 AAA family ATPase [Candidatus Calescibacterium sp.]